MLRLTKGRRIETNKAVSGYILELDDDKCKSLCERFGLETSETDDYKELLKKKCATF